MFISQYDPLDRNIFVKIHNVLSLKFWSSDYIMKHSVLRHWEGLVIMWTGIYWAVLRIIAVIRKSHAIHSEMGIWDIIHMWDESLVETFQLIIIIISNMWAFFTNYISCTIFFHIYIKTRMWNLANYLPELLFLNDVHKFSA